MDAVSIKKIKGIKVYWADEIEPWGEIEDVMFNPQKQQVEAFLAKTISIVPICKAIAKNDVEHLGKDKVILKKNAQLLNLGDFKNNRADVVSLTKMKAAVKPEWGRKKLKDIEFDFETGEMCDVIVSKNIIAGDTKVFINKIDLKDNTIYVED